MKNFLIVNLLFLSAVFNWSRAQTPLSMNGRLSVNGRNLVNECGNAIQLRGLSTHGVMFHQECYTESSVKSIAQDWKADLLRLAIYTTNSDGATKGYAQATDKDFYYQWIDEMVNLTEKYGIYVIIDWHILKDGNPATYQSQAISFFTEMSKKYKDKKHVIYEICNEPNGGTSWDQIKNYASAVIPAIRSNDPNAVILVGTPEWSSRIDQAMNSPLSSNLSNNVMYTLHFYAGSGAHNNYKNYLNAAISSNFPVFVSEWGMTEASGAGSIDVNNTRNWLGLMEQNKVSWANWQFSDKSESSSLLQPGSCLTESWTNFRGSGDASGKLIYDELRKSKNYTSCGSVSLPAITEPEVCPNASGGNLNIYGCPITNNFNTNYCEGYNNKQAYVITDFSTDSVPYFTYWKKPSEGSTVYSAVIENEQLVITSQDADPDYSTFGFDFGKLDANNHIPIDLRANAVLKFDVSFTKTNYSAQDIALYLELVDANENTINATALGSYNRFIVPVNGTTKTIVADFTNGLKRVPATGGTSSSPKEDTFTRGEFDFSKVTKVTIWVNPGVTGVYSRPPFSGTWTIDNFSLGYDESKKVSCEEYVDVDLCPNDPDKTRPGNCGCGVPETGCDCEGVTNGRAYIDLCGTCVGGTTGKEECDGNAFEGTPYPIPGIIEVENFDLGGQGVGYNDLTAENEAGATYRQGEGVDIELAGGSSTNYNIGYTASGEWLNYTVNVLNTGTYYVSFKVASERTTGSWYLEVNGEKLENSDFTCPNTGGWQTYQTVRSAQPIYLTKGKQVIRLVFDGPDANVDLMEFEADQVITSIDHKVENNVTVYPMPASQKVHIKQNVMLYNKAAIRNLAGNIVQVKNLSTTEEEVSLQHIASGVYIMELTGKSGTEHIRIVVE